MMKRKIDEETLEKIRMLRELLEKYREHLKKLDELERKIKGTRKH